MIASHSARRAENSPATGSTLIFPQQDQTRSLTVVDATVEEDDSEVTLEENSADDRIPAQNHRDEGQPIVDVDGRASTYTHK